MSIITPILNSALYFLCCCPFLAIKIHTPKVSNFWGAYHFGYATSFLEEAFGGLVREFADPDILNIIIISEEEPAWLAKIESYIKDQLIEKGVQF